MLTKAFSSFIIMSHHEILYIAVGIYITERIVMAASVRVDEVKCLYFTVRTEKPVRCRPA